MRVDASGHDHGEVAVRLRDLLDRRQEPLEGVLFEVDLVGAEAEVAAGEGSLEDDGVGAVVLPLPAPADELEGAGRRDDGDERGVAAAA